MRRMFRELHKEFRYLNQQLAVRWNDLDIYSKIHFSYEEGLK